MTTQPPAPPADPPGTPDQPSPPEPHPVAPEQVPPGRVPPESGLDDLGTVGPSGSPLLDEAGSGTEPAQPAAQ